MLPGAIDANLQQRDTGAVPDQVSARRPGVAGLAEGRGEGELAELGGREEVLRDGEHREQYRRRLQHSPQQLPARRPHQLRQATRLRPVLRYAQRVRQDQCSRGLTLHRLGSA